MWHIGRPHHISAFGDLDLSDYTQLLHIEQCDEFGILQQQHAGAGVEYVIAWCVALLRDLIFEVLHHQLIVAIEYGETITGHPKSSDARRSLAFSFSWLRRVWLFRYAIQIVCAVLDVGRARANKNRVQWRIVGHTVHRWFRTAAQLHHHRLIGRCEIQFAQEAIFHIIQTVAMDCVRRPLSFQFEDDQTWRYLVINRIFILSTRKSISRPVELTSIVTGCEQIQGWMSGQDPVALVFATECVQALAFRHVPYTDALVLTVRHHQLLSRMEQHTGYIVVMATECVHLPGFVFVHAPQFDLTIISAGHNQRQIRVETGPVDTTIMALEHVLHYRISNAEQIRCALQFWQIIDASWAWGDTLFAQSWIK